MITVEHLTKYYGRHLAVNDISFTINDNEILGFLGPNGAGKSTTMNMITGSAVKIFQKIPSRQRKISAICRKSRPYILI